MRASVLPMFAMICVASSITLPSCQSTPPVATPTSNPTVPDAAPPASATPPKESMNESRTKKVDVTDEYFGAKVADPYRWLEDGDSDDTRAFTARENDATSAYLARIPGREALRARVHDLLQMGFTSAPSVRVAKSGARRYFHTRREGTQNQPVLYVRDGFKGEDRELIDVSRLSADSTTALDWWYPSRSGDLVAWGRSESGSEESTLYVRDVATGRDLADKLPRTRHASVAWLADQSGFYYSRFPEPGTVPPGDEKYGSKIFFHKLGDDAQKDELVFGDTLDKTDVPGVSITPDSRHVIITVHMGWDKNEIYIKERGQKGDFKKITNGARSLFGITPRDDKFYIHTNDGAPRYELYEVAWNKPDREHWKKIIPEQADVLEDVTIVKEGIFATYLHDASSRIERLTLEGQKVSAIDLPSIGTAHVSGPREGGEAYVSFTSFVTPNEVYRLDLAKKDPNLELWDRVRSHFAELSTIEVTREWAISRDGTRVPMFIVAKKGFVKNSQNPTALYGYGGFNVNQTPGFSARALTFVERGGVWVTAVLRGGGEFGEAWHRAGMLEQKQNVFDDFTACAETLIKDKITSPEKLGIVGGSNGGLLVATAITQHPELYRVGLSLVPLTDMLRYHKFRIGKLWIPEYGSSEDEAQYKTLAAYSPLQHVVDGTKYPSMLFTTAESDSRVDPLHARKMAARMQEAQADATHPILLRVETKAGHGAGKPLSKVEAELTDEMSFLLHELGVAE